MLLPSIRLLILNFILSSVASAVTSANEKSDYIIYGFNPNQEQTYTSYLSLRDWLSGHDFLHPEVLSEFNCLPTLDIEGSDLLTTSCVLLVNESQLLEITKFLNSMSVRLNVEKIKFYGIEFSSYFADLMKDRSRDLRRFIGFTDAEAFKSFNEKFVTINLANDWTSVDIESYFQELAVQLDDSYLKYVLKDFARKIEICAFKVDGLQKVMTDTGWKHLYIASGGQVPAWEGGQDWECWGNISDIFLKM